MPSLPDDLCLPLDDGLANSGALKGGPERTCILNRKAAPGARLLRFVVGPDNTVVPDLKARLPGRGAWLTPTRAALAAAIKKKLFARAFRREVQVAADLPDLVERLFEAQALSTLSLANKAGAVICGFSKIEAEVRNRLPALILHASDAGADGVRKIAQALHSRHGEDAESLPRLSIFASAQLDLALGRENVIHALVLAVPPGFACLKNCTALVDYRTGDQSGGAPP